MERSASAPSPVGGVDGIDRVVSSTVVYLLLAVMVAGLYVVVVVVVSELVGSTEHPDTVVAILATTAVAAGFQPLRRRAQALADRVIYHKTTTPHRVLSELSRRVAANEGDLLGLLARSLVEGTGASRVEVCLEHDGDAVQAAQWPPASTPGSLEESSFPIVHGGVHLGSLRLAVPAGQRLSAGDRSLARQVAAGMGLAVRTRTLTVVLEHRVAALRASRRRIVALQDETRRRLERDLHDGAQQQLVALCVKLGLIQTMATQDDTPRTAVAVEVLAATATATVETVRTFARGVNPPLLDAEGLRASILAEIRRCPVPVDVRLDTVGRYCREIESTVNRCIVERVRQIGHGGSAHRAAVTVEETDGGLVFEVTDDGAVVDSGESANGDLVPTGLVDRVDALAGSLSVTSMPGAGTRLAGSIPITDADSGTRPTGGVTLGEGMDR